MPRSFCFYVSGHGFGHARRMTQVMRELERLRPDIRIHIRTAAPARVFEPMPAALVQHSRIDAGLVEIDPVTIDPEASLRNLLAVMSAREAIVAEEIAAIRRLEPSLIVADIPFLAGDVAVGAGVPCIGISNFTWDWIYANLFGEDARYAAVAGSIAQSYGKMSAILELPFGHTCPAIARKISAPLIAMRSERPAEDVLAQLGIAEDDRRPRVLIGTRGGLPLDAIARLARDAEEFLILHPQNSRADFLGNVIGFPIAPGLDFSDVLGISQIVVSKLGYGIVSECIATQTCLVWPPRNGFVEDAIVEKEAPRVMPMLRMSVDEYRSGKWGETLLKALKIPAPAEKMRSDGAEFCAKFLASY